MFSSSKLIERAQEESLGHRWIIELLIFLLVFTVASGMEGLVSGLGSAIWVLTAPETVSIFLEGSMEGFAEYMELIMENMPSWLFLLTLYSTVLLTLTVILYCKLIEKRSLQSMGLQKTGAVREYLIGIGLGCILITAAVGLGILTGVFTVSAAKASPALILLYLFGYLVQGMSEEVLCRGYLMVSLTRKSPTWLALVLSSLVFAALHLANPGISALALVNLFLCGMVFGVYVLRRGNLWGACAMHSFWNFVQGNIFGIRVSGSSLGDGSSLLTTVADGGGHLWAGGTFGVEGGLCVTIVLIAALALLLFLPRQEEK